MYQILDIQTKKIVSKHATRVVAKRKADRMDMQYGAIRYVVKFVEE